MTIMILASMLTATAQERDSQHSTLPFGNELTVHSPKKPMQKALKDYAYQPPIVGLLADLPSRV